MWQPPLPQKSERGAWSEVPAVLYPIDRFATGGNSLCGIGGRGALHHNTFVEVAPHLAVELLQERPELISFLGGNARDEIDRIGLEPSGSDIRVR